MSFICSYCHTLFFQLLSIVYVVLAPQKSISPWLPVVLLLCFLSSCATPPAPQVNLNADAHQLSLEQHQEWMIKGKLGFKSPEKKQSANFRWQQLQQSYQLNLTSIIGTSLLSLQGNADKVTLIADDKTYQDSDPSQLIWRVTGWRIPVEKLQMWVKGQHQQGDNITTSEQGWLSQLQPNCKHCSNWLINYDNYKLVDNVWLPHKVSLYNNIDNSQLLIRINKWDLHGKS